MLLRIILFRISKKITAGFNFCYLYGTSTRTSKAEFLESGYYNTQIQNTTTLNDILMSGGLQYTTTMKKGLLLTVARPRRFSLGSSYEKQ